MGKKNLASIDVAKFIAALMVVAIHSRLFQEIPYVGFFNLQILTRIAVPFFFVASGYFLFGRMDYKENGRLAGGRNFKRLRKYVIHLVILYCVWSVVFLSWTIPYWRSIDWWGWHALKDYVFSFLFTGSFYHFWYILVSIYGAIVAYFVLRICKRRTQIIVMLAAFALFLLTRSYDWINIPILSRILQKLMFFDCAFRGFILGMPLLVLGGLIARADEMTKKKRIFGLIISCAMLLAEAFLLWKFTPNKEDLFYLISTIPVCWFLFTWIKCDWKISDRISECSPLLRNLSTDIYCVHGLLLTYFRKFHPDCHSVLIFLFGVISSLVVGLIIEYVRCRIKNIKSKKLISL